MTGPDKPATHAHFTRLVVASPTCREQPSPHVSDGALTLREQAGSAASCDPSCRRCAPWPFMIVSQYRQGIHIMAFGMGVKWAVLEDVDVLLQALHLPPSSCPALLVGVRWAVVRNALRRRPLHLPEDAP